MTKTLLLPALLASAIAASACSNNPAPDTTASQAQSITVSLSDGTGKSVGTAALSPAPTGVKVTLAVSGLTPGEHAIHVHQTAQCDGPAFTSAGGHFNPEQKHHGMNNPDGPHAG